MVTLDITSFGTNPSTGNISSALADAGLSPSQVECVVVASSVTLPSYAFYDWSNLCSVENLDTCVAMGSHAFGATAIGNLQMVDIGQCSSIQEGAFAYCYYLSAISLANGLEIPPECFSGCHSLSNVVNLNHVVSIGA